MSLWYRFVCTVGGAFFRLTHHGVNPEHRENLPEGPAILCPNHTSLRDPLYIAVACGPRARLRFMAKAELFRIPGLRGLIRSLGAYPVRRGEADMDAIRQSIKELKAGGKLLIFPEGTRVTQGKTVDAKVGAAFLAAHTGVPIIPIRIENARTYFRPVRIVFGEPIEVHGRREEQHAAVERVMQAIEGLK